MSDYCKTWGLTINADKTNVIIFNKGGYALPRYNSFFHINDSIACGKNKTVRDGKAFVEVVSSYTYLGITFTRAGTFKKAAQDLTDKAKNAYFSLIKMVDGEDAALTLKLFDALVTPIATYGLEVWAPYFLKKLKPNNLLSVCDDLPQESLNVKLCKFVLGVGSPCGPW